MGWQTVNPAAQHSINLRQGLMFPHCAGRALEVRFIDGILLWVSKVFDEQMKQALTIVCST